MEEERLVLPITGMTCSNCARAVERALKRAGAQEAIVNFATEEAKVTYDPKRVSPELLIEAVERAGYGVDRKKLAKGEGSGPDGEGYEVKGQKTKLIVGVSFSFPLLLLSMGRDLAIFSLPISYSGFGLILFLLSSPVQFYVGMDYYKSAYHALRNLSPNMDVLVSMGSLVAYLYSSFALFLGIHSHYYFETAAVILTLIKVGKYLEARAKQGTSKALDALLHMRPPKATALIDGQERVLDIREIRPGMLVLVKPGESIPVDGIIEEGEANVEESMISGESIPVVKRVGDLVYAGTLNTDGLLRVRVSSEVEDTLLSRMVKLVRDAQVSRAPVQRLADKVSGIFVPAVIAFSLVTLGVWWTILGSLEAGLIRLVAVLVIACPCALGLATPTAIVAGTGLAARRGILFKSGEALEMAASIEGILMDKTGTLTRGKPTVMGLFTFDSIPEEEILALAASLEKASLHPLAKAIVEYANQKGVSSYPVTDYKAKRADGVSGIVNGRDVIIGRPAWLKEEGVLVEQRIEELIRDSEGRGFSLVMMGVDKRPCSLFLISDEIRDEASHVVSELQGMGIEVVMLTGDNPSSARRVAQEVGIKEVIAPVRADQKVTILESFKGKGKKVGMVGDGINDAPALAKADLGIAIGGGTDIAISAGHVVILGQDIRNIPKVITIGRLTMRHIKENLFWAFGYNVVLIPLAAGVLHFLPGAPQFLKELHPIMAALAMALSSLTVVLNSLRLSHKGAYL